MTASSLYLVGNQQAAVFGLPDTTARHQPGILLQTEDNYWGSWELVYGRATAAIRQFGLAYCLPTIQTGGWRYDFTELANTANLGRDVYVAMTSMTTGQYGWFLCRGIVPVNCNASVAADTSFGVVATGQGGAVAAGKQILNARIIAAGATTVAKANSVANSGSTRLLVANSDGWFIGAYLSGTGIAASTVVTDIDPSGTVVTLSVATTAAVSGTVTATYNNATVYYNVALLNRPFAQGAIT